MYSVTFPPGSRRIRPVSTQSGWTPELRGKRGKWTLHSPAHWSETPGRVARGAETTCARHHSITAVVDVVEVMEEEEEVVSGLFPPPTALSYKSRSEPAAAAAAASPPPPSPPPPPHMEQSGSIQLFHWEWMPTLSSWGLKASGNLVKTRLLLWKHLNIFVPVPHSVLKSVCLCFSSDCAPLDSEVHRRVRRHWWVSATLLFIHIDATQPFFSLR